MKTIWNLPQVDLIPIQQIEETRPVALVYSTPARRAVAGCLNLPVVWETEACEAKLAAWDRQIEGLRGEVVYSLGGGLAADVAKYCAARSGLPLVVIPTALSVDAFITPASGIRRDGCVHYIETKSPEQLILDLEIIAAAPAAVRAAGIADVLSIATGCWDWKFAHERGKNPPGMQFVAWQFENAQSILNGALDCAEAAGRGDRDGLKTLYDCLALEVQLCNQIGHSRPEEGTEHYFAYYVENLLGHGLPHGDLVGPGIMLAARWQGQDTRRLETALKACHIPLDRIPGEVVEQSRKELPAYCIRHALPYAIAHELIG